MPTLVQINTVINSRSTGRIAESIGALAIKQGWDSFIAYGREPKNSSSKSIRIGKPISIAIHLALTRLFDIHGLCSFFATKTFLKKLDLIKPDIIHLHNIHGYYLNYNLLFKWIKENNIPTIWTLHDCWPYTGHCAYYSFNKCNKWQKQCHRCPAKKSYPQSLLFSNAKRNFLKKKDSFSVIPNLTIITPSTWLRNELEKSFLNKYKCVVINNGIDLSIFYPRTNTSSEKTIILGVASVWEKRKGLDDFIKLSGFLSNDEQIILIGVTEKQIKKLPSNIIGYTRTENQNKLAEMYCKATVFVNPTYEDNFPTTNLEALACGTPVITYNSDGSPETITHGKTGFIVEKGDISGLLTHIREIKGLGKKHFSSACIQASKSQYDMNVNFKKYIDVYNDIMKGSEFTS